MGTGVNLVTHKGVETVSFIVSTEVVKAIIKKATGTVKKVGLKLGGKWMFVQCDQPCV